MVKYERFLTTSERQAVRAFAQKVKQFLGPSLVEMRLFGSKVRGDFDPESDIDILLLIELEDWKLREEITRIAADTNLEYGCNISPVIYTRREHERNRYFRTLFVQETEREGLPLA